MIFLKVYYKPGDQIKFRKIINTEKCTFCNNGIIEGQDHTSRDCPVCNGKGVINQIEEQEGVIQSCTYNYFSDREKEEEECIYKTTLVDGDRETVDVNQMDVLFRV